MRGEYSRAEQLARFVIRFATQTNDDEGVAVGEIGLAAALRELGDRRDALTELDKALDYYRRHPDDVGAVGAWQSRGIIYLNQGDFARALVNFQQALAIAEEKHFRDGIIPALNSIGEVYREQGNPEAALEFYAKARAAVGDDAAWNMAFIFNNIGQAYEAIGDLDKAVDAIERARAVAEKSNLRPRVATSLAVLAKIRLQQKHNGEARDLYEQSLNLSRELRDRASEARALLGIAEVQLAGGAAEEALATAEAAVTLFRKIDAPDREAAALTLIGQCQLAAGLTNAARASFEQAIAQVEHVRGRVAGDEAEVQAFLGSRLKPYHELVSLLVDAQRADEALAIAERASARVLLDATAGGGSELSRAVLTEAETARRRDLDRRLAELNQQLSRAAAESDDVGSQAARRLQDELRSARADREAFDAQTIASHPELKRAAPPDPIRSVTEIASVISADTVLLKFVVTERRCFALVVAPGGEPRKPALSTIAIDVGREELTRDTAALRSALAERALDWQRGAKALYRALLGPVEPKLKNARRLVICPDGPLWDLPFQVLQHEDRCLIDDVSIRYAPSLSMLARSPENADSAKRTRLLVVANPSVAPSDSQLVKATTAVTRSAWSPLPEMEAQAKALADLYRDRRPRVLIGPDAQEEITKREMPEADVLHFATHGVLNDRAPLYSYLLLSQRDLAPGDDGFLEAWELLRMRLHARLAVLCGCETARGKIGAGEGVIGLSWSFLVAGCPTTVVTQWKIDSASSTPLMLDFHRQLLGGSEAAEALRHAMLKLRKDSRYRHPFYWAPFVVVGSGR